MNFVIETVFVGIYCSILYYILLFLGIESSINQIYVFLFVFGFIKHLLAYFLQFHTYYCNHGDACYKNYNSKYKRKDNYRELLLECLGEGCLFLLTGGLFLKIKFFNNNRLIAFFLFGFSIHILFELLGFHTLFCKHRCIKM